MGRYTLENTDMRAVLLCCLIIVVRVSGGRSPRPSNSPDVKRNQDKYNKDKVFVDNTGTITPKERRGFYKRNEDGVDDYTLVIKNRRKNQTDLQNRNQDKHSKDKLFVYIVGAKTKRYVSIGRPLKLFHWLDEIGDVNIKMK